MTVHPAIARLRAADRAPAESNTNEDLYRRIVATPGDPRLRAGRAVRRRRTVMLAVVAGAVILTTGAAWAASATNALHLFRSNPQYTPGEPGDALWHQTVIASSVTRAATVTIPGSGKATFWYAKTRQGGWCAALRLPTGVWSGESGSEGGTAPGCFPTRTQINGSDPVYVITGFDYQEGLLTVHGRLWRIYYGIVDGREPAVRVTDRKSGRSTSVKSGHLWAIAIPSNPNTDSVHLVAYDRNGAVVADEAHPLH
jgi:hypothetical protein